MRIYLKMKTPGKRRPILDDVPYEIPDDTATLRELLTALVHAEVETYNRKPRENPGDEALSSPDHTGKPGVPRLPASSDSGLLSFLSPEALEEQAGTGKVSFGRVYSAKQADLDKAVENALQCVRDGLVRVFWEEQEITGLEEPLSVQSGDHFTLIRLTFLAGRLW